MAPFKYEPFVNPYVGSIIDLMGQGDEAKAQALLRVGEIEAQAARQRGQAWSGAVQSIGNIASSAIEKWNSPEARQQRDLDEAEKIHAERSQEQQQHPGLRVVEGHAIPEIVPPERVEPFSRPYRDSFGVDPSVSGGSNPLRGAFGAGQSVDARDPSANALEGAFGTVTEGRSPDDLQSYLKDPVSRYTTKNGLYDIQLAHADLLAAGVSPSIANTIAKQGLEANTIFDAADALDAKYQQSQIDVRGAIADMAISLHEISPDMTWDKAVEEVMGPAEYRENPEQFQQFMVQFHGESPEGKEAILRNMVSEWDRQGPQTVTKPGDRVLGQSGNTMFSSPLAPTAPMAERMDYEAYAAGERLNGREPLSFNGWVARDKEEASAAKEKRTTWVPRIVDGKLSTVIYNPAGWPEGVYNSSMVRIDDPAAHVFPVPETSANSRGTASLQFDPAGNGYWVDGRTRTTTPAFNPDGTPVKQALTSSNRTMKTGAQNVKSHIPRILELAKELDTRTGVVNGIRVPLMGVFGSRVREAFAKIGAVPAGEYAAGFANPMDAYAQSFDNELNKLINEDPSLRDDVLVAEFASNLSLLASGAGRVHGGARGGGSITMINYMKSVVSATSNYAQFIGRMRAVDDWMTTYADMGESDTSDIDWDQYAPDGPDPAPPRNSDRLPGESDYEYVLRTKMGGAG